MAENNSKNIGEIAQSLAEQFQDLAAKQGFDNIEEWTEYLEATRISFRAETGIYERATLKTQNGAEFRLCDVYFWSERLDGDLLVDLRREQLPPDIALGDCRLTVFASDRTPLFDGSIVDDGDYTLGNCVCVQVDPTSSGS